MQRSEEEKQLLRDDMYATLTYWLERMECITKAIAEMSYSADQFSRGATCSLQQLKWEAELHLSRTFDSEAFGSLIVIPTVVMEKYKLPSSDSVGDDSSDSSCDSDSDSSSEGSS